MPSRGNIFDQLSAGAVAVTSTRRLARYLVEQYAAYQHEQGKKAWPTPRSATWEEWIIGEWRRQYLVEAGPSTRVVLDDEQEFVAWENVVRLLVSPEPEYVLLQTPATARAARDTWRLIHDWQIPLKSLAHSHVEDTRAFYQWATEFEKYKDRNGWLCTCELSALLVGLLRERSWRPEHRTLFIGFDFWPPAQQALLSELEAAGAGIERVASPAINTRADVVACMDRRREFESAAQWSKDLLNAGATGPIGIIVDDLRRNRDQVEIVFDQVLHPAESLSHDVDRTRAFHLSLGRPLDDYPVIDTALTLLGFLTGARPMRKVSRILHTPFIAGGIAESLIRPLVDLSLRQRGWDKVSLDDLLGLVSKARLPADALVESLHRAVRYQVEPRQSPSAWAVTFVEWLSLFGWPGERALNSAEYQTISTWRELLSCFAGLNIITPTLGVGDAVSRISQMTHRRVYQPRSDSVPVQIMGVQEASGMQFTHVWISGMSDDVWPAALRPSPFLPYSLQRSLKLPGTVAEQDLERCGQITRRLTGSANDVVISFPRQSEGLTLQLSPLYRGLPESTWLQEGVDLTWYMQQTGPELASLSDNRGPVVDAAPLRGGVGIFKDQAVCPFRAFTHHRLSAAALPVMDPGLGAAARGTLTHAAMAGIWRGLGTWKNLAAMSAQDLDVLLSKHVDAATGALIGRGASRFQKRVLDIERQRLFFLLRDWLQIERTRTPFRVKQVERELRTSFAGIEITLRVDRIDELDNGQSAIIDYKTGRVARIDQWVGERPDDPQLPLYLLSVTDDVGVLAFAHLRPGQSSFRGLSQGVNFAAGVQVDEAWMERITNWRLVLDALGKDFKDGVALVDPKERIVCRTCDVTPFCRIFDLKQGADDGNE